MPKASPGPLAFPPILFHLIVMTHSHILARKLDIFYLQQWLDNIFTSFRQVHFCVGLFLQHSISYNVYGS